MTQNIAPNLTDPSVHSLTVKQTVELYGCSLSNGYKRIREGDWPTVSVGRRKFVPASFVRRELGIELRA